MRHPTDRMQPILSSLMIRGAARPPNPLQRRGRECHSVSAISRCTRRTRKSCASIPAAFSVAARAPQIVEIGLSGGHARALAEVAHTKSREAVEPSVARFRASRASAEKLAFSCGW